MGIAEELRGKARSLRRSNDFVCKDFVAIEFGISSPCKSPRRCCDCYADMFERIADRIDAERALPEGIDAERALPEGVEWPRFEDGEPVKVGDEVEFEGETWEVDAICFDREEWSMALSRNLDISRMSGSYDERVKRPTPKVLGADGVPIEVGDTVYCDDDPRPLRVIHISDSINVTTIDDHAAYYTVKPPRLTHERPDSWEKLEKDARETACNYAPAPRNEDGLITCDGCPFQKSESCSNEMMIDLVERAKKLAKAGEVE